MSQNKKPGKPQQKQPSKQETAKTTESESSENTAPETETQKAETGAGEGQDQTMATEASQDAPEAPSKAQDSGDDRNHPVDDNTAKVDWPTAPTEGAPEGRILEADEELAFDGEEVGNMVVVKENVYRKIVARGSKRTSYVMLYRKGSMVPITTVQRNQNSNEETNEEKNEG